MNVIPIVNENDTVANEELKYGDNDTLSALVALAINANKLILLTDIENLYSKIHVIIKMRNLSKKFIIVI